MRASPKYWSSGSRRWPKRLPEVVAHHFTEAGLASEAIDYWLKAGRLASARSANREAVTSFEQALRLLETPAGEPRQAGADTSVMPAKGFNSPSGIPTCYS